MTEVQEALNSREPISDPNKAEVALEKAFNKEGKIRFSPFDSIIIATTSSQKQAIIANIATELGVTSQPTLLSLEPEQEKKLGKAYSHLIEKRGENPELYSFDLVLSKLANAPYENNPVLVTDTTVIDEKGHVLEKPQDEEEAKAMIESILGSKIKIVVALGLIAKNSDGQKLIVREGVEILLKTKKLSRYEIRKYFKNNSGKVLQTSGGVDFAGEGQMFIDESEPITVRTLDLAGKVGDESTLGEKEVKLTKSAIGAIQTYFIGAPKHPIKALISLNHNNE